MKTERNILKGKWIVQYDPAEFVYGDILEFLPEADGALKKNNLHREYIDIVFHKHIDENTFRLMDDGIYLELNGKNADHIKRVDGGRLTRRDGKPGQPDQNEPGYQANNPAVFPPGFSASKAATENILLYFPFLMSDKRWQTLDLTAASIFLGSSLKNHGFKVTVKKLRLPAATISDDILNYDLVGFTLFEELLPEFKVFLDKLSVKYTAGDKVLLAAGGPLVTLNPLQAAYHLPDINLLVRGEAELIFPGLLKALNEPNLPEFLKYKGFLFQKPGLIVMSGLDTVNRPADFRGFRFDLSFLEKGHLKNGLEINFSRGCRQGCLFCSQVQGRELRELPLEKIKELLGEFSTALDRSGLTSEETQYARSVNINDDDILQDMDYTREVLKLTKKFGFKLWGIQSSLASFFDREHNIREEMMDMVSDRDVFVNSRPLIWLGSDCFLPERGKRLGKHPPFFSVIENLVEGFESRDILNYHYWISSDHESTWEEFAREFIFIYRLQEKFKTFSLIAHSPFVVPYHSTPLYRLLVKSKKLNERIKEKILLKSSRDIYTFPLIERVETGFGHLNKLLKNERLAGRPGFFDSLKQKEHPEAFITLYNFLKQERIHYESLKDQKQAATLIRTEKEIEHFISKLL
ncbi:B12-binding domain-containing radical SAM protein [Acidobacteriota bacterium]